MWPYNQETKAKFAQKNMKKKGYTEGIDQIENTPEIAAIEEDASLPVTPQVVKKVVERRLLKKLKLQRLGKEKPRKWRQHQQPGIHTVTVTL